MVCRLAERQDRYRRAAPVENLVRGKHAAVRRSRGAAASLRSPQDGLHPQTSAVRVPKSLQLFQVHVREEPIHLNASGVARLAGSRKTVLNRSVLLRRARRRQLTANLKTVAVLHERRVSVLGTVIRSECPWNSHVSNKPLHHSEDGRCALIPCPVWALKAGSAVHKYDDLPRASQDSGNGPVVPVWTRSSGASARDVVRCGVGARMSLAIEHPEYGASSPTS